jgi:hypothetical protein
MAQKPVANLLPEVVGNAVVGERLVCAAGSWSGAVSEFRYEWIREGIPAGFGVTFSVTFADEGQSLWCVVTAIGSEGSAEAESSNSLQIAGPKPLKPPENTIPPAVSGTPAVGEILTCSPGTWSGGAPLSYTYQWVRDPGEAEATIASATTNSYRVAGEDAGHVLACRVAATNSAGSAVAWSAGLPVPGTHPEVKEAPRVLGVEPSAVGESLTCAPGKWEGRPVPNFSYRWIRDFGQPGQAVVATGQTYKVVGADQLHALSCVVIASNSAGSAEVPSANSVRVRGASPENELPPHVPGKPEPAVGETLTCEEGTWRGVPAPEFAFQWIRNQGASGEEAIAGQTGQEYTLTPADQGRSLSCEVTAHSSEGSASESSNRVVVSAEHGGSKPELERSPRVAGSGELGRPLTCEEGSWSGKPTPTLSVQWLREGLPIISATAPTHTVVAADQGHSLSCEVVAWNEEGELTARSNSVAIPAARPKNLEPPQVAGTPAVGEQLTCLSGSWSGEPPPALSYQWLRDGSSISGASRETYEVLEADQGHSLSCLVTARNSGGSAEALSARVEVHGERPRNTHAPEVAGTPAVGVALSCSPGEWAGKPPPTFSYQWLLNGTAIPSATGSAYTVLSADRGLALSCEVTAANSIGSATAHSGEVHVPGSRPVPIEAPVVSGHPTVLQQLTCEHGTWNAAPPPTFAYQWLRDGVDMQGASSSTYTVQLADEGHQLSCTVVATNGEGKGEANSAPVSVTIPTSTDQSLTEPRFPPPRAAATAAEIAGSLKAQLARAQHRARISALRRRGLYTISVAAPAAGTLQLVWYEAPPSERRGAKPVIVATASASFSGATTKSVNLRLTSVGRHLVEHSFSLKLTLKGVFTMAYGHSVSWSKTVVLTY